ncbi:hypothetical protein JTE90_001875 [Oedothorax gibbosus]|uniref:Secreted protein n=1 Tax=Oedothorax gibbosus TaxID=931172 RepID=A0AAV6VNJ0_9ARAC|nr:hypothetical protein JTE90_001875 [Oedothorax gibbosus]
MEVTRHYVLPPMFVYRCLFLLFDHSKCKNSSPPGKITRPHRGTPPVSIVLESRKSRKFTSVHWCNDAGHPLLETDSWTCYPCGACIVFTRSFEPACCRWFCGKLAVLFVL